MSDDYNEIYQRLRDKDLADIQVRSGVGMEQYSWLCNGGHQGAGPRTGGWRATRECAVRGLGMHIRRYESTDDPCEAGSNGD